MTANKKTVVIFKRKLLAVSETFIRDQAIALAQTKSWKPILLARKKDKNGITIPVVDQIYASNKLAFLEELFFIFNLPFLDLRRKLIKLNPDLLHIHFGTQAVKYWPTFRTLNIPILITLHGADINLYKSYWEKGKKGFAGRFYPKRLINLANQPNVLFIAVSEAIKKRAIEYGIPESKIKVSYIGTDTSIFPPSKCPLPQRPNKILFIGRFVDKKKPDALIKAFVDVKKIIPDARLDMIGTGPLLSSCKSLAKEFELDINFLGNLTSEQVSQALQDTKVFCLPSVTAESGDAEGFGIVLLEAMASGVPCITSARGGAGEGVINNETGICFTENNISELTDGLVKILSDSTLAERFSKAGIERVTSLFDNRITSQHLISIYDQQTEICGNQIPC